MEEHMLITIRKQAEEAVADMPEGPLKIKAFEVILHRLLDDPQGSNRRVVPTHVSSAPDKAAKNRAKPAEKKVPASCPERILSLREEGFFASARTLGEIRNELQMHGWTYPVTSLSGPLQRLVQNRELRRMAGQDGKKGSYAYVVP